MVKNNEYGGINIWLILLIFVSLLFVGAAGFGYWAYGGRQDYKNNVQSKVNAAVQVAIKQEDIKKDANFAQQLKEPYRNYDGPAAYGSLHVSFPKTWSAYVNEQGGGTNVDGYFYPSVVPTLTDPNSSFALRVQVLDQSYSQVMQQLGGYAQSQNLLVTPYTLPLLPNVIGTRFSGEILPGKQGIMVVLPLRSGSLKVWTEAPEFFDDFNNNILPNLTFSP